jgi:hypothetical protein
VLSLWSNAKVVYAVFKINATAAGELYRYDTKWSPVTLPTAPPDSIWSVWGRDEKNVWAVGEAGAIYRLDKTQWRREVSPTHQRLRAVAGDKEKVWALGDWGAVLRLDK